MLGGLILTAVLVALIFIDIDTQYLPGQFTSPSVWLGLLFNFDGALVSLQSAVLGAACKYMSLWLLNPFYRLIRGVQGTGTGDFELLTTLGAWLDVGTLPMLVFMSALIDLAGTLIMRVARSQPFAFGPSFAIVGWVMFTANEPVDQLIR